jgi:hypothetical protein
MLVGECTFFENSGGGIMRSAIAFLLIALLATAASASFFDIFTEITTSVSGPPYPTTVLPFQVVKIGDPAPVQKMNFNYSLPVNLASHVTASTQGGGGGGGRVGVLNFYADTQPENRIMAPDSFFDIFLEISSMPGSTTGSHFMCADSFFDIFLEISMPGVGEEEIHVHGEALQNAHFNPALSGYNTHIDSFFDIFTEITLPPEPEFDLDQPYMRYVVDITPEPATLGLLTLGGLALLRRGRK